ncbi:hypothetical protein EZS27_006127 [termite gut metagenome]|uniref:Uncharacterized protein n=1 Tax=termite gut metagenome TaxID=433724 RepID=A0A5J4SLY1_9ZZZZ
MTEIEFVTNNIKDSVNTAIALLNEGIDSSYRCLLFNYLPQCILNIAWCRHDFTKRHHSQIREG